MESIFQKIPLRNPSFFQKLFNQTPEENAVIEINNLLATRKILEIKLAEIDEIVSKYKVNLSKSYPANLKEFYAVFLNHCLKDKVLSDEEINELKHLKEILNLNDKNVEEIHNSLTGIIYKSNITSAIKDGRLTEEESQFLDKLQSELKLPEAIANKISEETRGRFVNDFLQKAVSDERLSPEEEQEFLAISKSLNVNIRMDEKTRGLLDKYKLLWTIENAELTPLSVNINLPKTEQCYFQTDVQWYEQRTITKRINYGGPVARVKIMKGVYYRVGSISGNVVSEDEWRQLDTGMAYLTNKRIIFMGTRGNKNIRLNKVLAFTPYTDGIGIEKDTGRSPLLRFSENVDICAMLLSRLLRES